MYQILLVMVLFAVAGCASPGPQSNPTATMVSPEAFQTPDTSSTSESTLESELVQSSESVDHVYAQNDEGETASRIEDIDSPDVERASMGMVPDQPTPESAIVCERVVPTGSIIPVKVCRDLNSVARKSEQDRKIFDDIKTGSAIGGANAAISSSTVPIVR